MSKEERDMTEVEAYLLHTISQHIVGAAMPQFAVALVEAKELAEKSGDKRATHLYEVLNKVSGWLSNELKDILDTIPGVIVPTPDELIALINEAQAEEEFLSLVKSSIEKPDKLH